jgi:hypothetical protein
MVAATIHRTPGGARAGPRLAAARPQQPAKVSAVSEHRGPAADSERGKNAASMVVAALPIVIAVAVGALGLWKGAFVAGDGDAFGYVSEARLIVHGSLRIEQQFVRELPWPFADWSFSPAGYRPATERGFIVPTYPIGVPLIMALFQRVAGERAVFYVVPAMGALCIWMTSMLGAAIHGRITGLLAAVLMATSPSFLFELMAPASDVAATALWTTALVLTLRDGEWSALGAGLAAALAVLTRPNLVPLAAVVGFFFIAGVVRAGTERRLAIRRTLWFGIAASAGCIAVALIDNHLYGSPLNSGYEPLHALYALANAGPNLDRYPRWLIQSETPFVFLALAAPFLVRAGRRDRTAGPSTRRGVALLAWFAAIVCASYLFYRPFGRDEWTYLRFLLPAYPALLVLAVMATLEVMRRVTVSEKSATAAALIVCFGVAGWMARESIRRGALMARVVEQRYVDVGRFVDAMLPTNSIFIAKLHAGSIRYYANRLTINYEWLEPRWLDAAVKELTARGYHPFIALEEDEEAAFRERFAGLNTLASLDWPPVAVRREPVRVRIYDPADRDRFRRGEPIATRSVEPVRR